MLCWTDNILQNIVHLQYEYGEYLHNIISPTNMYMQHSELG